MENEQTDSSATDDANLGQASTLDPPGSIAVVGGGVLGVEAALYGRFLGYAVTLVEENTIGHSAESLRDEPLPMLPDRCLSPLAFSALQTQQHESDPSVLPVTVGQWIDDGLVALAHSDLLRGRVLCQTKVTDVEMVPVETDGEEPESDDEDLPDDFCLKLTSSDGMESELRVEALIIATGSDANLAHAIPGDNDYCFRIGGSSNGDVETNLRDGYRQIVAVFAGLAGRQGLDLYRPKRL